MGNPQEHAVKNISRKWTPHACRCKVRDEGTVMQEGKQDTGAVLSWQNV